MSGETTRGTCSCGLSPDVDLEEYDHADMCPYLPLTVLWDRAMENPALTRLLQRRYPDLQP